MDDKYQAAQMEDKTGGPLSWKCCSLPLSYILLFQQCFLLNQIIVSPFVQIFDILSLLIELEEPKIGIWGNGLKKK